MQNIGICGAGLIGASWAIGFANAGYKSLVYDNNPDSFKNFENVFDKLIKDLIIINPDLNVQKIKLNIKLNCSMEEICKDSILIQESIIENLEEKKIQKLNYTKLTNTTHEIFY